MDDSQLETLVKKTVHETLKGIGFKTDSPTEIQEDIAYLRKIRRSSERLSVAVRVTAITSAISVVVGGLLYGLW